MRLLKAKDIEAMSELDVRAGCASVSERDRVKEIEWHLVWFANGSLQLFKSMRCSIDLLLYSLCTYSVHHNKQEKYLHRCATTAASASAAAKTEPYHSTLVSVGTTILFNLNINNLLQREVNWRYVDIWKQCQQQHQEQRMTIFYSCRTNEPTNEWTKHCRKIIHRAYIYLVSRRFHFTTIAMAMNANTSTNSTGTANVYYI